MTTLMVGFKKKNRSHTQKSHPKGVNQPQRYSWGTQKKKKKKSLFLYRLTSECVSGMVCMSVSLPPSVSATSNVSRTDVLTHLNALPL